MNVLTRTLKAGWEETSPSISYVKRNEFEQYVRDGLFPGASFTLIENIHGYHNNHRDFSQSSNLPDFKFKARNFGLEFFVEAKFRSHFQDQIIEWGKFFELNHYQVLDNIAPVILAIGLGGRPSAPERIFLIPVRHVKFIKQYPSMMQKFELESGHSADVEFLRRILE